MLQTCSIACDLVELHKAGARHGMHRVAGRIGNEMKMKPRHRRTAAVNASIYPQADVR